MNRHAFSLVELSIVLVILGLLTGGILAGQSLIRASQLRAVTTEYQRYTTAVQSFRDKYFAIPGDMTNATAFWGKSATYCNAQTGTAATPGTCNGDGNGVIFWAPTTASATNETFQFWNQLALAGLIEGSYTGASGSGSGTDSTIGINIPKSKMSNAGWTVFSAPNYAGDTVMYALDYGNALAIGAPLAANWPAAALLKPEEAWNIDTKMDDGKPGYGRVIARYWNNACATGGASNTDLANSVYNLSISTTQCALHFIKQF